MVDIKFNLDDPADYAKFLAVKALPQYKFVGRTALIPDEYASRLGVASAAPEGGEYVPIPGLFDYQEAISRLCIRKHKYCVFMDCGLGKTLVFLEYARHVAGILPPDRCVLIVSPLMVVEQTLDEARSFYGRALGIERVRASDLSRFLADPSRGRIGITNYDALDASVPQGRLGSLILDESSMLKSAYGKWGADCIRLGRGLDWKLALTGTPAPNDRIEFANHAVFMDAFPNVNSFLARFFVNRGQTDNRWELKPHALRAFYKALSHWSIFVTDPGTYGWKDNSGSLPPIEVFIHDVDLTADQRAAVRAESGGLFVAAAGGITSRTKLARIAKTGDSRKPEFIRSLADSWPGESTLVWCRFNSEQERLAQEMPQAASITGSTPFEERSETIADFQAGRVKTLISKPRLLGLGLNMQVCTRQIFSSLHDSYEEYYQAVKRSNRVGSTKTLHVHIPITEVERPMVETVLRKAGRVEADTREQEAIFRENAWFPGEFR